MKSINPHRVFHIYEDTYKTYPHLWFESKKGLFLLILAVLLPTYYVLEKNSLLPNTAISSISVILSLIGISADIISTQYISSQKPAFDKQGIYFPVTETGLGLPPFPLLKDHFISFNAIATLLSIALAFLFPSLGVAIFAMRLTAAFGNLRQYKRLTLTLQNL